MNRVSLRNLLFDAIREDLGAGDITSEFLFSPQAEATGELHAKAPGVLAGLGVIQEGYDLLDSTIQVDTYKKDGDIVKPDDLIATASGSVVNILNGERVILNILQHMSGVATVTYRANKVLDSDHTRICDTRKTLPGLRMLDKYAVRCGGGYNHRMGLYDGIIIKDNHIAYAGSIQEAVDLIRSKAGHMTKIEVETENEDQVREAIDAEADVIMFDNQSPEQVKEWVNLTPDSIVTEVSGGIDFDSLPGYRNTGVDYISMGMLTHSANALDISFNLK